MVKFLSENNRKFESFQRSLQKSKCDSKNVPDRPILKKKIGFSVFQEFTVSLLLQKLHLRRSRMGYLHMEKKRSIS